jgi:uncharacterized protein with von Willebrand factor type A (vWA) domain
MEDRIVEFANVLRRNGVRVSLSENIDAFRALRLIGIHEPSLFRDALRATLVKQASGHARGFWLFFWYHPSHGAQIEDDGKRV